MRSKPASHRGQDTEEASLESAGHAPPPTSSSLDGTTWLQSPRKSSIVGRPDRRVTQTPPSWSVKEPQRRRSQVAGRCADDGETSLEPRNHDLGLPLLGRTFVLELVRTHVWGDSALDHRGTTAATGARMTSDRVSCVVRARGWCERLQLPVSLHRTPADAS